MIIVSSRVLVKVFTMNFARAITIFPFILLSDQRLKEDKILVNHEMIHIRQQLELLVLPFYLWYLIEFFIRYLKTGSRFQAYVNISFEKEAYANENNLNYNNGKKFWSFLKYI